MRMAGRWPVRMYSYAEVRDIPSIAAASSTETVTRSMVLSFTATSGLVAARRMYETHPKTVKGPVPNMLDASTSKR